MAGTHRHAESAEAQGRLWGGRATDWAEVQEKFSIPLYEAVLDATRVAAGKSVLDVGCGAGGFCAMAAATGAKVAGLDASQALIEIAQQRTPTGDFRTGDMQRLPFGEAAFDAVTGFNSFQHAPDPATALKEAGRVLKPGGLLAAVVWGEGGDFPDVMEKVRESLPESSHHEESSPAGADHKEPPEQGPFAGDEQEALFRLLQGARFTVKDSLHLDTRVEYPDAATLLRGMMSPGPVVQAIEIFGEQELEKALLAAVQPFQVPGGGYRLVNRFIAVIGSLPGGPA